MTNIHALLIAAGKSERMGAPKQILPWGTTTLIAHQIDILQQAQLSVSVVLGANAENIKNAIAHLNVQLIFNEDWEQGMGTSIACGVKAIHSSNTPIDGILVALVDQPLISVAHFRSIITHFETGKQHIIVSKSQTGITGPPVLFDSEYLEELKTLQGDEGAKPIIKKHSAHVVLIPAESPLEDMDTPEAYQRMLKRANLQS